jgi:hypothetical protein
MRFVVILIENIVAIFLLNKEYSILFIPFKMNRILVAFVNKKR